MPLPKLHELLAVRPSLKVQAAKVLTDLANTFEKKRHHFTAKIKTFTPLGDDSPAKTEEELTLQTSVTKELAWLAPYLAKSIDAHYHIAVGNMAAQADILLDDGSVLAANVPASTLLELETFIDELRGFAEKIPTLDPALGFTPDATREAGVYVSRLIEKTRHQQQKRALVMYPATDKHPAQTQLIDEAVPVGTIREREWSSMLTPVAKGDILDRIEGLSRAIKTARAKANEAEVDTGKKIGDALISYAFTTRNGA